MTGNVDRQATPHVSAAEYRRMVQQDLDGGTAPTAPARGGPRRPSTSTRGRPGAKPKPAATKKKLPPAARKRAQRAAAPHLAPAEGFSRGPWTVEVDFLGRPLTMNDERASAMSRAVVFAVREDKRAWQAAFVTGLRHLGVPPLDRVWVVHQLYYPNNVVPDGDAFGPSHKAVHDSLVEAGVLPNDRRRNLPFGYLPLPPFTDGGPPRMAFTVFPLGD